MHKYYTTKQPRRQKESLIDLIGGKANAIAMLIFAVITIGGGIIIMDIMDAKTREAQYLDSWPITINQHVQLGYAKPTGGAE